ncbi:isopentenyl phosphate kinase family protein [Candidatus Amesbacteria bacterium]|nr:isopentenyl phosphate kinase family protein [Candidatus Amesbacteria bacterium]
MQNVIFVKLGGGLITDKQRPFVARRSVIRRLALEIKWAMKGSNFSLIVGHGSGSFGHSVAAKYKTQEGVKDNDSVWGVSEVSDAAIKINRVVMGEFLKAGLAVVSFAPKSFLLAQSGKVEEIFERPLVEALELGLIPVVYGDVVMDTDKGCGIFSSERIIRELATRLPLGFGVEKIVYCGNTDGVYSKENQTIPVINPKIFKTIRNLLGGSDAVDVTGGMLHKVNEALETARRTRSRVIIMNGLKAGNLQRAIKKNLYQRLLPEATTVLVQKDILQTSL